MDYPTATMSYDPFILGSLFSALFLILGLALGVWASFRWQESPKMSNAEKTEIASLVSELSATAHTVSDDVSQYRHTLAQWQEIAETSPLDTKPTDNSLWQQVFAANQELQTRLEQAEHRIHNQAGQLEKYLCEARTDSLTGLGNRRAFETTLEKILSGKSTHSTAALFLFDADYFKSINDTYGHPAGDLVLKQIALCLQSSHTKPDLVFRLGGEEFALLLPKANPKLVAEIAEKCRQTAERLQISYEQQTLQFTLSGGVAYSSTANDVSEMLRQADLALYAAKEKGRNQIFWHDGTDNHYICGTPLQPSSAPAKDPPTDSRTKNSDVEKLSKDPQTFQKTCQNLRSRLLDAAFTSKVKSNE
ncbi:MAG: GGDEF domain-containing protein [Pirellulaceae bacterium]|nr:GGDEF domain-containing protein [Pirellulaceae bacterium]